MVPEAQGRGAGKFGSWLMDGCLLSVSSYSGRCGGQGEKEGHGEGEREEALVRLPLLIKTPITSQGPHPHDLIET